MKKVNHIDSIRNPIITEKATILSEQNKTVFKVHEKANKKTIKKKAANGNKSKKNEKKRISDTKNIEPGNPKNISIFRRVTKNNFGHKKFKPPTSDINLVLNLRAIASTSKKELVDIRAWLISIAKLANIRFDCPLIIHIVNQCISTTVE